MGDDTLRVGFFLLVVVVLGLWATDCATGSTRYVTETVVERSYSPAYTEYGTTYTDGKTGTTTIYHSEQWTLITQDDAGNVHSCSVNAREWAAAVPNSTTQVAYRKGGLSGIYYKLC